MPAINAFGPAISMGVTLAFFINVLFRLLKNGNALDFNTIFLFGISAVSLALLFIGGFYHLTGVAGVGNIKMYPLMYGSFLAYLASSGVMWQVPWQVVMKSSAPFKMRLILAFYIVLLVIGAIGGLTEPFTFHLT